MGIGVLALVRLSPERVAALTAAGYDVREGANHASRVDALRESADSVRAVLTNGRWGLTGAEMDLLPKLEIVCAVGAGYEAVDLDTARRRGIAVANSPDTNASAVADSAMMLLMATSRHLLQADRFVRAGGWQDQWRIDTPTLSGKRLGILGLGTIGSQIAHRAACGFDMEVGYHNRAAVAGSPYRYFVNLTELATWADFLIAAAPGGEGTRHLIDADVLRALGPKGYVVNVGRGTVIDTVALIDALKSKRIAGAGLDVLEGEPSVPPKLQELLQFDNVVITPHIAGRAPEARTAATALIIENLNAHFGGKPLVSPVLPKS
ncbi:MAG TPA: 2-hydroxyacid dehydrogenase [Burkholderiales bacterium]|nr:2-hydroxyacid dehydrogenase [Burkholderiales bacterium]